MVVNTVAFRCMTLNVHILPLRGTAGHKSTNSELVTLCFLVLTLTPRETTPYKGSIGYQHLLEIITVKTECNNGVQFQLPLFWID